MGYTSADLNQSGTYALRYDASCGRKRGLAQPYSNTTRDAPPVAVSRVGCRELSLACSSVTPNRRVPITSFQPRNLRAASDITPMANAARFWLMRSENPSFTSAKSPDPIGIAAHP